jgi:predicted deacetylase
MVKGTTRMQESRYLVRFDDICPTMNWAVWEGIEAYLDRFGVKPILAVVPDNQDPKLMVDEPRADFWDRVRGWQAKGYTIAVHGYRHQYINTNPGRMGLTFQSEFAGLSRAEQEDKLRKALAIFESHGVKADAWVAPSHSFDKVTVDVLADLGVPVISDGLWPMPFTQANGITWVPQQLWSFERMKRGIWTVCNHHNGWSPERLAKFGTQLEAFAGAMTDVASVVQAHHGRQLTLGDRLTALADFIWTHRIVGPIWDARRRMRERRAARA